MMRASPAVTMRLVTLHPLHVKPGHDDGVDDHSDDIHHYASPASPAVIMTIIATHPLHS